YAAMRRPGILQWHLLLEPLAAMRRSIFLWVLPIGISAAMRRPGILQWHFLLRTFGRYAAKHLPLGITYWYFCRDAATWDFAMAFIARTFGRYAAVIFR